MDHSSQIPTQRIVVLHPYYRQKTALIAAIVRQRSRVYWKASGDPAWKQAFRLQLDARLLADVDVVILDECDVSSSQDWVRRLLCMTLAFIG